MYEFENVKLDVGPSIANHTVEVVEADAVYVKPPFDTDVILIHPPPPGQTTNVVLLKTHSPNSNTAFASDEFRQQVPEPQQTASAHIHVDNRFFFTVGLGTSPCPKNHTCKGPNGTKLAGSVNNVSFTLPTTALLQAHFFGKPATRRTSRLALCIGSITRTGTPPNNTMVSNDTKVVVLPFNRTVELVMQDTSILGAESHPLHLHGFNFYVVRKL
ncbi:Laccase-12/13 [Acorus gramineus]|uniref:Laccase-12/13 n=1 Tax=Acorus gramineus TaxID=55184 RepID=A0AAV9AFX0_ACOGR|nr:Laccase-12/13 [Acorus gramineus]